MKYLLSLLFLSALVWSGCYYDNEEELYPAKPDTAAVSYAKDIQPMINGNCAVSGCHVSGAQSPALTSYAAISGSKDRIKARAVDGNPSAMPPTGLMSAANRNKLGKWIMEGAKNN